MLCDRLNDNVPYNSCDGVATAQSKKRKEVNESREGVRLASLLKAQKCRRGKEDDEFQHLLRLHKSNKLVDRHMSGQPETPPKV